MSGRRHWDLLNPNPTVTQKKSRVKKTVVHNIFEKFIEYTTDPFWISIFTKASHGKLEKNFTFREGVLAYKRGTKTTNYLLSDDILQALIEVKSFMYANGNIVSPLDMEIDPEIYEEVEQHWSLTTNSLSDIKQDRFKQYLINLYIDSEIEKNQLGQANGILLKEVIHLGLLFQNISNSDFHVEKGRITSVEKLEYIPDTKKYYIRQDIVKKKRTERKIVPVEKDYFISSWQKLMKMFYDGPPKTGARAKFETVLRGNFSATNTARPSVLS
jgi:hypothetical protein